MSPSEICAAVDRRYPLAAAEASRRTDGRARHIVGARGGSAQRCYRCNICGIEVDSESAQYPATRHAERAIFAHAASHEAALAARKER